jgi:hypothetical protein
LNKFEARVILALVFSVANVDKNFLNIIFPFLETATEKERDFIILVSFSTVLFLICIVTAISILPEHCSPFSSNIESGFACDGVDWRNPKPCAICRDKGVARIASIIAGLGLAFFLMPATVIALKNFRSRPVSKTNLFD